MCSLSGDRVLDKPAVRSKLHTGVPQLEVLDPHPPPTSLLHWPPPHHDPRRCWYAHLMNNAMYVNNAVYA